MSMVEYRNEIVLHHKTLYYSIHVQYHCMLESKTEQRQQHAHSWYSITTALDEEWSGDDKRQEKKIKKRQNRTITMHTEKYNIILNKQTAFHCFNKKYLCVSLKNEFIRSIQMFGLLLLLSFFSFILLLLISAIPFAPCFLVCETPVFGALMCQRRYSLTIVYLRFVSCFFLFLFFRSALSKTHYDAVIISGCCQFGLLHKSLYSIFEIRSFIRQRWWFSHTTHMSRA